MSHDDFSTNSPRYVPISVSTKHIVIGELTSQQGHLQARVITLIVSDQKHLGQPDKLEKWNDKGKLAFFDTVNKTIIYSPAVWEKLQAAAPGDDLQFRFVHQEGGEQVELDWTVKQDHGQAFLQILEQQRADLAPAPQKTGSKESPKETTIKTKTPPLKGRVEHAPAAQKTDRASQIEMHFYRTLGQITGRIQEAKREAQKMEDQQNKDNVKHTEEARDLRHHELNKSSEKKDLHKVDAKRTKEDHIQQTRIPGTSLEAQKEPPTTTFKG